MNQTSDDKNWVGLVQGPFENGNWTLRISIRDAANGTAREYAFDNRLGTADPARSEIVVLNDHQFLVLEGRGADGKAAATPSSRIWAVDVAGAQDIAGQSNAAALLAVAPTKVPFQDASAALRSFGLLEAEGADAKETASSATGGAPDGIRYDPEFLARGEAYLPGEAASNGGIMDLFTGMELGLPGLGRLARDQAAMPGLGGLVILLLGLTLLGRIGRRRPAHFRR